MLLVIWKKPKYGKKICVQILRLVKTIPRTLRFLGRKFGYIYHTLAKDYCISFYIVDRSF